ncbi:reverse transcriptase domain-containing protein [Tanacetum coccineum]|uniref:Reverse transcriptase domain-containing protein n=1 Tax=Tanacetum coccineum TaxID=301880 RepID=A0ABQ4YKF3_9ASTR
MAGQALPQGPIPDLRPMKELLQAPTESVGDAIVVPPTTNLRNEITRFQQRFGETFSEAWDRFKDLLNKCPHHGFSPLHQIDTFYNSLNQSEQDSLNSAAGGNLLTKNTQEALTIIENKSKVQTSRNKPQASSSSGSSTQDAALTALTKHVEALISMNRPINSIQNGCETYGGPHAYYECRAAGGYTQEDAYATTGTYNAGGNSYQPQVLPSNTVPNPREDLKAFTALSGVTLARPSVLPPPLSSFKEPSPASTSSELPPAPFSSPVIPEQNPHQPPILYPSRLNKDKLQDKYDIQIHSFLQMFKKLYFNISLAEALAHMPKFAKMVKDLLTNKVKLLELANTPLNENCSGVLLKKLPEKLGDTRRFLIPCDFYRLKSCMALADLGASINLMPLSVWKTLSLPELTPTRMTLELATQTVAYPASIAEDVFVQVGKFTFPTDFVVVDYDVDPRVRILQKSQEKNKKPGKNEHETERVHKSWEFIKQRGFYSMNYIPVSLQNQANPAGSKEVIDIDVQTEEAADLMVVSSTSLTNQPEKAAKDLDTLALKHLDHTLQQHLPVQNLDNTCSINLNTAFRGIFEKASYDDDGIISDLTIYHMRKVLKALKMEAGVEAMQEELLQFKLQQLWCLSVLQLLMKRFMSHNLHGFVEPDHPTKRSMDTRWAPLTILIHGAKKQKGYHVVQVSYQVKPNKGGHLHNSKTSNTKDFSSQFSQEDLQVPQGQPNWIMVSSHFNNEAEYVSCCKLLVDKYCGFNINCWTMVSTS